MVQKEKINLPNELFLQFEIYINYSWTDVNYSMYA